MKKCLLLLPLFFLFVHAFAQDPLRFKGEVDTLTSRDNNVDRNNLILFVGSSSFRLWNINASFPDVHLINRGFGGSEMSDLVYYADRLIIPYAPKQILIYEGDNDLSHDESPDKIIGEATALMKIIRSKLPATTPVIFLTPKPSPSRWHLKKNYIRFVKGIKKWARHQENVQVIDVWHPLLKDGKPMPELFKDDKLHMNDQGYLMWKKIIEPYLKK